MGMDDTSLPFVKIVRYIAVLTAYFLAAGVAVGLTRFEGGVACVWFSSAVLLAVLSSSPTRSWPFLILGCGITGTLAAGLWGLGWSSAPLLSLINVAEPTIAAVFIHHWRVRRSGLDSLRSLSLFVIAAGLIAPAATALPGAAVVSAMSNTGLAMNVVRWFIAHALGMLTFTPVFAFIASGELRDWFRSVRRADALQAFALMLLVAAISLAVFLQTSLPVLFLPVLPLIIVTFRLGRIGAAAGIVIIAVVGGWLTLRGLGPVGLLKGSRAAHIQFFQFYLSVTVMTVLPVAADLARRSRLFEQLRDSEARFRLLTENSTDIVMNLHVDGTIRYVSPSIVRLGGHDPDVLLGQASIDLIAPEDRDRVRIVHLRALRSPGETFIVEFRAPIANGDHRWFESHTQAVADEHGVVSGVVSAVRETSVRKRTEVELSRAANTDALTGLCNRRAFDEELRTLLSHSRVGTLGCVAMFDLDHFKRVNDRHGHAVGDEVLKAFATAAAAHVREGDMFARIGGEEFGLIFPSIPLEIAAAACERIRIAVATMDMKAEGWPLQVTVSIGVAPILPELAPDDVLRAADRALYDAKTLGRNRYALAA